MILRERMIDRRANSSYSNNDLIGRLDELAFDDLSDIMRCKPHDDIARAAFSWTGTSTVHQLLHLVDNGWPELEKTMLEMLGEIQLPSQIMKPELTKRRKRRRADFGNELDIHAVYQGRVDRAWDQTHVEQLVHVGNKTSHICVNLSAPCTIPFEAAMWRGAVALRIYETLTMMGRSVAISGYYAGTRAYTDGTTGMASCKLKAYGEPMRTDKLAAMVNLGFMRVLLMARGLDCHPRRRATSGRGYPIDDYELITHAAELDAQHGGSVFVVGQCFSKDQAALAIEKFVRQLLGETKIEGMTAEEILKHGKL